MNQLQRLLTLCHCEWLYLSRVGCSQWELDCQLEAIREDM